MILTSRCPVIAVHEVAPQIYLLTFRSSEIAGSVRPGQFVNIRVEDGTSPLLRRPFSVYRTEGENVQVIFNIIGRGTQALSSKKEGDFVDVLGPLGVPFSVDADDFETAILVGGGLGVAPLPILSDALRKRGRKIVAFLGVRTARAVIRDHLDSAYIATDDGSAGFHGTVVDLLQQTVISAGYASPKIFACGPTPMLRALAQLALRHDIPCEVSLEGPMGCGFGICQGCPVELVDSTKTYALMCIDGPAFDARKVRF